MAAITAACCRSFKAPTISRYVLRIAALLSGRKNWTYKRTWIKSESTPNIVIHQRTSFFTVQMFKFTWVGCASWQIEYPHKNVSPRSYLNIIEAFIETLTHLIISLTRKTKIQIIYCKRNLNIWSLQLPSNKFLSLHKSVKVPSHIKLQQEHQKSSPHTRNDRFALTIKLHEADS